MYQPPCTIYPRRDSIHDRRSFIHLDQRRGTKLRIPETYDDPLNDILVVRRELESAVRQEKEVQRKSLSGEHKQNYTSQLSSSASTTPEKRQPLTRSPSVKTGAADVKPEKSWKSKSKQSKANKSDPLAHFADFEQTATTCFSPPDPLAYNPFFEFPDPVGDLVSSLQSLPPSDISIVVRRLVAQDPSLGSVIDAALRAG